ncbi:MAG: IclR family transcriptional regulator [Chloroflexi bacterium]|nr:IclR family transcriptional regulator [Chloroflexota bacterium]
MLQSQDSHSDENPKYDIAVLNKAIDVLEYLADGNAWSVSDLSVCTGLNKATVYRILGTLERRAYVRKDPDKRQYSVGRALLALSRSVLSSSDLTKVSRPILLKLREEFRETVNLGVIDNGHLLYLDVLESERGLRTSVALGSRDHLHSTALGKAMLASLPPAEARRLLSRGPRTQVTPRTITNLAEILRELDAVRERGYAVDREENETGAHCVGVAVLGGDGRPLAAISMSGPAWRVPEDAISQIGARLRDASHAIELALGLGATTHALPVRPRSGNESAQGRGRLATS